MGSKNIVLEFGVSKKSLNRLLDGGIFCERFFPIEEKTLLKIPATSAGVLLEALFHLISEMLEALLDAFIAFLIVFHVFLMSFLYLFIWFT